MGRRKKRGLIDDLCGMIGGLCKMTKGVVGLIGCFVPYGEAEDNCVERGSDFWGHKYKKTSGMCYRCHGTGSVHGKPCPKCDGTGKFSRTTWYS